MIKPILLAAITVALTGCATTGVTGASHPVKIGQTTDLGGPKLRPVKLIEDSRCPANARCVWAGRLVLRVDVRGRNWHRLMDLTLGEPQAVASGMITLVSVNPPNYTNTPLKPRDYRFDFTFVGSI